MSMEAIKLSRVRLDRCVGGTHALNDHCREPRAFVTRFENGPCGAARKSKRVGVVVERAQSRIDQGLPELLECWPTGVPSFGDDAIKSGRAKRSQHTAVTRYRFFQLHIRAMTHGQVIPKII
jgi:hypothetical protein